MANWCNNNVRFFGDEGRAARLNEHFRELCGSQTEDKPWFKSPVGPEDAYFTEAWIKDGVLHYDTTWSPEFRALVAIADLYGVGFVNDYCEMGMMLYGRATYENGDFNDIRLNRGDFINCNYDEDRDVYLMDGVEYPGLYAMMETLLSQKITISDLTSGPRR